MADNAQDKREHTRIAYNGKVLINKSIEVLCNDISAGGMFILSKRSFMPGSTVQVTFSDVGLTVTALVQSSPPTGGHGLMFTDLNDMQKAELVVLVSDIKDDISRRQARPSVLIVDDSESVRSMNRVKLTEEGFDVIEAIDGIDAIKILGTQVPKAVVLDLNMGQMDGYKVLSFMKGADKLRDVPVIVFSSKFSAEEQSRVSMAGADLFLAKMTTSPVKLAAIVRGLIAKRAGG